jgi:hypothetical protein
MRPKPTENVNDDDDDEGTSTSSVLYHHAGRWDTA